MIGYDLDGVIAQEGRFLDFWFARKPEWAVAMRDSRLNRCIGWPTYKDSLIVTGRPVQDERSTRLWLYRHDIHAPVMHTEYLHALDQMAKADFVRHSTVAKIEACQRFDLKIFVESDAGVRAYMREKLPFAAILSREEALREGFLQPSKPWASAMKSSRHENFSTPPNHT